jgi:hypothetical protein
MSINSRLYEETRPFLFNYGCYNWQAHLQLTQFHMTKPKAAKEPASKIRQIN